MPARGATFDRKYRIERVLGKGGFAIVFLAKHIPLAQMVALKLLHPCFWRDESIEQRFVREAKLAMRLAHPNVIPVREFNVTEAGQLYYTMDYSPGETLAHLRQREGRLHPRRALLLARDVLRALDAAHAEGIVHRDVKPSNILVERGPHGEAARLSDFGLAKVFAADEDQLTGTGSVIGSPSYMSPEQARGQNRGIDHRTDLYSLGVLLFELLSGRLAFEGSLCGTQRGPAQDDFLQQHLHAPPPSIGEVSRHLHLPIAVDAALQRALQKDAAARFQSAREFVEVVEALILLVPEMCPTPVLAQRPAPGGQESTQTAP